MVIVRELPEGIFTGVVGSYGKVVGARSGLIVIGQEGDPFCQESAGYLGEATILEANANGLDSCWVGGFFDRGLTEQLVTLSPGERVLAVSPLGLRPGSAAHGERVLKRFVGAHKRRAIEEIAPGFDEETWPAWAAEGVRLARAAPSAVNRQPWEFRLETDAPATSAYAGPTGAVDHIGHRQRTLRVDLPAPGLRHRHAPLRGRGPTDGEQWALGDAGAARPRPLPGDAARRSRSRLTHGLGPSGARKNSTPTTPAAPKAARMT